MRLSNLLGAVAALSLAASPAIAASSNPAAKLSLAGTGAAGVAAQAIDEDDGPGTTVLYVGAAILVIAVIILLVSKDDDEDSASA